MRNSLWTCKTDNGVEDFPFDIELVMLSVWVDDLARIRWVVPITILTVTGLLDGVSLKKKRDKIIGP